MSEESQIRNKISVVGRGKSVEVETDEKIEKALKIFMELYKKV